MYSRGKGINKHKTNKQIKCVCLVKSAVYDAGTTGLVNSEAEMLAFVSGACSVTGAQGRKDLRKGGETALFEPDVVFRHIKKAQHIMLRVF